MDVAETYSTLASGITLRNLESARRSRSARRGSSGARCASIRKGVWIFRNACSSASENEFIRFSEVSQLAWAYVKAMIAVVATTATARDSNNLRRTAIPSRVQTE